MWKPAGRPAHAGLLLATFTLAFMAANPVFGFLSRDEDRRLPLALGAGTALAGILAIVLMPAVPPCLAVAMLAFGTGGSFTLSMTLPLDNTRACGRNRRLERVRAARQLLGGGGGSAGGGPVARCQRRLPVRALAARGRQRDHAGGDAFLRPRRRDGTPAQAA